MLAHVLPVLINCPSDDPLTVEVGLPDNQPAEPNTARQKEFKSLVRTAPKTASGQSPVLMVVAERRLQARTDISAPHRGAGVDNRGSGQSGDQPDRVVILGGLAASAATFGSDGRPGQQDHHNRLRGHYRGSCGQQRPGIVSAQEPAMTLVVRKSTITGIIHTRDIPVTRTRLKRWLDLGPAATHIQDAFPALSEDDREFLMNGTTPEDWSARYNLTPVLCETFVQVPPYTVRSTRHQDGSTSEPHRDGDATTGTTSSTNRKRTSGSVRSEKTGKEPSTGENHPIPERLRLGALAIFFCGRQRSDFTT